MHVQTHIMSGWCVANLLELTPRERLFAMIAASAADLDAISIFFGQEAYWDYHHLLGHNLPSALLTAIVLAVFSQHRLKAFLIYFALFHLHLLLDYFGSGPGWPIHYGWPIARWTWVNPNGWEFYSWQNTSAAGAFLAWTAWFVFARRRTPLEAIVPSLDRKFVQWID